jgi:hypothetical protein
MTPSELIVQYGIAGAVITITVLFLKFLREERQDRRAERESFVKSYGEMATKVTQSLDKLAEHCERRWESVGRKNT